MTTYYLHQVNPHAAHDHADFYFNENGAFVIVSSEPYPVILPQAGWVAEDEEGILEVARQLRERGHTVIDQREKYPASHAGARALAHALVMK